MSGSVRIEGEVANLLRVCSFFNEILCQLRAGKSSEYTDHSPLQELNIHLGAPLHVK